LLHAVVVDHNWGFVCIWAAKAVSAKRRTQIQAGQRHNGCRSLSLSLPLSLTVAVFVVDPCGTRRVYHGVAVDNDHAAAPHACWFLLLLFLLVIFAAAASPEVPDIRAGVREKGGVVVWC